MSLYDLVWNFLYTYIFSNYSSDSSVYLSDFNSNILGIDINFAEYLSHIGSIIIMIIILLIIAHFIKKTFNLFGRII